MQNCGALSELDSSIMEPEVLAPNSPVLQPIRPMVRSDSAPPNRL